MPRQCAWQGAVARLHGVFDGEAHGGITACAQRLTGSAYCFHEPSIERALGVINFA